MKLKLDPITTEKMTNLLNTVRRLKTIAQRYYDQKNRRFPRYCQTPPKASLTVLIIRAIFWSSDDEMFT